ncbi:HGxxPAAW family protein [Allobranchiibius huperziae]|uniref:HGxxPAAW family protein n=1 Tax=Allobranchiibius huperziae TaxID=1874116 RepID=UPI003CCD8E35
MKPDSHGNSIAAWTGVVVILLGSVLIGCGVAFGRHALDIAGVVACAVGAGSANILSRAGFGAPHLQPPPRASIGESRRRSSSS